MPPGPHPITAGNSITSRTSINLTNVFSMICAHCRHSLTMHDDDCRFHLQAGEVTGDKHWPGINSAVAIHLYRCSQPTEQQAERTDIGNGNEVTENRQCMTSPRQWH